MLNWDDPLGVTDNNDKTPEAVIARAGTLSEPDATYVAEVQTGAGTLQPGDGLQRYVGGVGVAVVLEALVELRWPGEHHGRHLGPGDVALGLESLRERCV